MKRAAKTEKLTKLDRVLVGLEALTDSVRRMEARLNERSAAENVMLGMILPSGPLLFGLSKSGLLDPKKKTPGRKKCASK